MKPRSYDKMKTGALAGLFIPFVTFFVIVVIRMNEYSLTKFIGIIHEHGILPKLLSLCLLPNLLLFFLFIRSERLRSAKGVILSMFIYGFIILLFKFV